MCLFIGNNELQIIPNLDGTQERYVTLEPMDFPLEVKGMTNKGK